jgi:hypothetical protein
MNQAEVMDVNAKSREKKKEFALHHVEIHPERDANGKMVKGGGHTVKSVHHEKGREYGDRKEAEKPFGAGDHEAMLAHVANQLQLPEPDGGEDEEKGDEDSAAGAAT